MSNKKIWSPTSLGDDISFFWDGSMPFSVKPSGSGCALQSDENCSIQTAGEFIDCRIPETSREMMVKGKIPVLTFRQWQAVSDWCKAELEKARGEQQ